MYPWWDGVVLGCVIFGANVDECEVSPMYALLE